MVAPAQEGGIQGVGAGDDTEMKVEKGAGADSFLISGTCGHNIEMYNTSGIKIADVASEPTGDTLIDMGGMPGGLYIVRSGGRSAKLIKH